MLGETLVSCLCRDCIADYLESLVKKVREEVKREKAEEKRQEWLRESESSGV